MRSISDCADSEMIIHFNFEGRIVLADGDLLQEMGFTQGEIAEQPIENFLESSGLDRWKTSLFQLSTCDYLDEVSIVWLTKARHSQELVLRCVRSKEIGRAHV